MTPRRSSGGPQCAFEENKKERERAEQGSERGSRAERKSRRALLRQTSQGPRGHREALCGGGRGATSAAAAPGASERSVGRAATSASLDCIFN